MQKTGTIFLKKQVESFSKSFIYWKAIAVNHNKTQSFSQAHHTAASLNHNPSETKRCGLCTSPKTSKQTHLWVRTAFHQILPGVLLHLYIMRVARIRAESLNSAFSLCSNLTCTDSHAVSPKLTLIRRTYCKRCMQKNQQPQINQLLSISVLSWGRDTRESAQSTCPAVRGGLGTMARAGTNCYESPRDFYFWTWSSRRSHLFPNMQVHRTAEVLLAVQIHILYFRGFVELPIAWKSEWFFPAYFLSYFFLS